MITIGSIFTILTVLALFALILNVYFLKGNCFLKNEDVAPAEIKSDRQVKHAPNDISASNPLWKLLEHARLNSKIRFVQQKLQPIYLQQKPFPHIVVDDMFPMDVIRQISLEIPDNATRNYINNCVVGTTVCIRDDIQQGKSGINNEKFFKPATIAMFSFLRSATFLDYLEKLTNISGLVPDPQYTGSGIHQTIRGGFLGIHSDSNSHSGIGLVRRVNLFVFLNDNWKDSYGGHLEMWDRDLNYCYQMVRPLIGRLVIFSTTDFTYHGHQTPLACPEFKSRRSIALYYYSYSRPDEECYDNDCLRKATGGKSKTTLVKTRCSSCEDKLCKRWIHT